MEELVDYLVINSDVENPFYIDCSDEGIWFIHRGNERYFGSHIKANIINLATRLNKAHRPNVHQSAPLTISVCWNDHEKDEKCDYVEEISPAKEGLYKKYIISKPNDGWVDPKAEYFVFRLDDNCKDKVHLNACRQAMGTYWKNIKEDKPQLANDIFKKYLD